jgi:hypothetical protein
MSRETAVRNQIIILILLPNLATNHATLQVHVMTASLVRGIIWINVIAVERGVSMSDYSHYTPTGKAVIFGLYVITVLLSPAMFTLCKYQDAKENT